MTKIVLPKKKKKILIRHDKESFATQPDGIPNILIDDYGVNVRKWKRGGVGLNTKIQANVLLKPQTTYGSNRKRKYLKH